MNSSVLFTTIYFLYPHFMPEWKQYSSFMWRWRRILFLLTSNLGSLYVNEVLIWNKKINDKPNSISAKCFHFIKTFIMGWETRNFMVACINIPCSIISIFLHFPTVKLSKISGVKSCLDGSYGLNSGCCKCYDSIVTGFD